MADFNISEASKIFYIRNKNLKLLLNKKEMADFNISEASKIFYNLLSSLTLPPLRKESFHRNHVGAISHCDAVLARGRFVYRRHNSSTVFVSVLRSGDRIKCGLPWVNYIRRYMQLIHQNDQRCQLIKPVGIIPARIEIPLLCFQYVVKHMASTITIIE